MKFFVPVKIESHNKWVNRKYGNSFYRGYRKMIYDKMAVFVGHAPGGWAKKKRAVRVVSVRYHFLDKNSLEGGLKPVYDALQERKYPLEKGVRLGWIVDDSTTWADIARPEQRKPEGGEQPGIWIFIDE